MQLKGPFGIRLMRSAISPRRVGGRAVDSITILLVEDETIIQAMVEDALKEAGFAVTVASRGEEAIAMLMAPDAAYRALVTDIDLADDITGWEVASRARQLNADFPVIYITGGGANEWASHGVPNSILIPKPFAPGQVGIAVSQLLNQGNTPGA